MRTLLFLSALLLLIATTTQAYKVGVIGAGIGGSSFSFYLDYFLKQGGYDNISITVFEKNDYIGGRLKHIEIGGLEAEVGGDAWSSVNQYLLEIASLLKVRYANNSYDGNGDVGYWNGTAFLKPEHSYVNEGLLALRLTVFQADLKDNYKDRANNSFAELEEFLSYGKLNTYYNISTLDYATHHLMSGKWFTENMQPITHTIYNQDLSIQAFAGFVSFLPDTTTAYTVQGGNSLFVEAMFNAAGASVALNTTVTSITKTGSTYTLMFEEPGSGTQKEEFDYVILAAPYEFANLTYSDWIVPEVNLREYTSWYVTLIIADGLNSTYFTGVKTVPDTIMEVAEGGTSPFSIIYVEQLAPSGQKLYKIFSSTNVDQDLNHFFINVTESYTHHWNYTFPIMEPGFPLQPISLGPNFYYLNAMESIATAMEASTIAGRNIALTVAFDILKQEQQEKE